MRSGMDCELSRWTLIGPSGCARWKKKLSKSNFLRGLCDAKKTDVPQRLKSPDHKPPYGTAEAVPFQSPDESFSATL